MQNSTLLGDRSVLAISGPEGAIFLQGLLTNDMSQLEHKQAIYAALLTPQGKILFDFFVVMAGENSFLIDCAASQLSDLSKRLKLYRLRAKVEITENNFAVAAAWGDADLPSLPDDAIVFVDPRHPALGKRVIASEVLKSCFPNNESAYHGHRIQLGVPNSADLLPDTVFALDAGFEELNGVSFTKGCYVGQEVTSRMKHRASARKRFFVVESNQEIPPGTPLEADGLTLGTLSTGVGNVALALLRVDRLQEAEKKNIPITLAGNEIVVRKPVWLDA